MKKKKVNFTEQAEEDDRLFMAHSTVGDASQEVWFIDSGCSNHMSGTKSLFRDLDESKKSDVRLGNDKQMQVAGKGKQSRNSFPSGQSWRASNVLELLHADLCGPKTESLGGSKYFLLLTDDYCRWSWVYFLKFKSEAFETCKKFKVLVEKHSGRYIKTLRTDLGGEFCSDEFNTYCKEHGIQRELIAPRTPEQNGVAERKNRTVVEMARSMLKAKNLPNMFWGEAIATAIYLQNLSPTKAVMKSDPYEAWQGRKPRVSHLKVFGCITYALFEDRSKLDEKSQKCIFIGYCTKSKAYRLYNPLSGKVIVSRNVIFNEEDRWEWSSTNNEAEAVEFADSVNQEVPATTRETETSIESTSTSIPRTPSSSSPGSMTMKNHLRSLKVLMTSMPHVILLCMFLTQLVIKMQQI